LRNSAFCRYLVSASAAAALLPGCGVLWQDDAPSIGAPAAMPLPRHRTVVHSIRTPSLAYEVLYSFGGGSDGANPDAALIDVNGTLYGTTFAGGTRNEGTVFGIGTSGSEHVLHRFVGRPDGWRPEAALIDVNGALYGTTYYGGSYGGGSVFSMSASGTEQVLYSFGNRGGDGWGPVTGLLELKGALYGTTLNGGRIGLGTVFRVNMAGGEHVLHSFGSSYDGVDPMGGLTDVKGTLYGTTMVGGNFFDLEGTVFTITTAGKERVLYNFRGRPGAQKPKAGLIDVNGTLYGTTDAGGTHRDGTVFSLTTAGAVRVLHSFGGHADGARPEASLIDVNGVLYGTTHSGGAYGRGTVFSITTTGTEAVLHSFGKRPDGANPAASLIDANGTLYGTTYAGGSSGRGTVFALGLSEAKGGPSE
jgi:uncharacterized repeat protein (TIGR03803 family)